MGPRIYLIAMMSPQSWSESRKGAKRSVLASFETKLELLVTIFFCIEYIFGLPFYFDDPDLNASLDQKVVVSGRPGLYADLLRT